MSATYFQSRAALILCKREPTEGTDSVPVVGTDEVPVLTQATIATAVTHGDIRLEIPAGGQWQAPTVAKQPTATIRVPLYGKGIVGDDVTQPTWINAILRTCGILDNSVSGVLTWTPTIAAPTFTAFGGAPVAQNETFTLYAYLGLLNGTLATATKRLIAMVGCRVQSVRFVLNPQAAEPVHAEISVVGRYVEPVDVTTDLSAFDIDDLVSDFLVANALASKIETADTVPGTEVDLCLSAFDVTVDYGSEHIAGDCNDSSGVIATALNDITVSANLNPLARAQAVYDYEDRIDDADPIYITTDAITPEGRTPATGYSLDWQMNGTITGELDRGGPLMRHALTFKGFANPDSQAGFTQSLILRIT